MLLALGLQTTIHAQFVGALKANFVPNFTNRAPVVH
jgi:hypothetical protein